MKHHADDLAELEERNTRVSKQILEHVSRREVIRVNATVSTAWLAALDLDCMALSLGNGGGFRRRYLDALERTAPEWKPILQITHMQPNQKAARSLNQAKSKACKEDAFLVLHFRECLRDGASIGVALVRHAKEIGRLAKRGRPDPIVYLADAIRENHKKPLTRSLEEWVVRAWLPLALWDCDTAEALRRLTQARRLLYDYANVYPHYMRHESLPPMTEKPTEGGTDRLSNAVLRVKRLIAKGKR